MWTGSKQNPGDLPLLLHNSLNVVFLLFGEKWSFFQAFFLNVAPKSQTSIFYWYEKLTECSSYSLMTSPLHFTFRLQVDVWILAQIYLFLQAGHELWVWTWSRNSCAVRCLERSAVPVSRKSPELTDAECNVSLLIHLSNTKPCSSARVCWFCSEPAPLFWARVSNSWIRKENLY